MSETSPTAAAVTAPDLDATTHETSLARFLDRVDRPGVCVRCGAATDSRAQDWASYGQVDRISGKVTITGGIFCAPCVGSWNEWMSAGRERHS